MRNYAKMGLFRVRCEGGGCKEVVQCKSIWRVIRKKKPKKLRIHNITAKAALKFGSEAWVLKKREEQRLEAAQMKFLRHLLGITKLD